MRPWNNGEIDMQFVRTSHSRVRMKHIVGNKNNTILPADKISNLDMEQYRRQMMHVIKQKLRDT